MRKTKMFVCPYNQAISCKMDVGCLGCKDSKAVEAQERAPCSWHASCGRVRVEGSCTKTDCHIYDPVIPNQKVGT